MTQAATRAVFPVLEDEPSEASPVQWLSSAPEKVKLVRFGTESVELIDEPDPPASSLESAQESHDAQDEQNARASLGDSGDPSFDQTSAGFSLDALDAYERGPMLDRSFADEASELMAGLGDALPPSLSIPPPESGVAPAGLLDSTSGSDRPPSPYDSTDDEPRRSLAPEAVEVFAKAAVELAAARQTVLAEVEHQLLELSVAIASAIVEREIELQPELHGALAKAALEAIKSPGTPTLRASREAYGAMLDVFGEPVVEHDGGRVRVELDPTLDGLGVVAETAHVRVDGRLAERLRMVLRAMEDERRRKLLEAAP